MSSISSSLWRHNGRDSVSNHQPHDCLLKRLFGRTSKRTSKLRVTGLCEGNSPETGEFPAQRASNAENVSIWWRHHVTQSNHRMGLLLPSAKIRYHENAFQIFQPDSSCTMTSSPVHTAVKRLTIRSRESRSCEMWLYSCPISFTLDRRIGSCACEISEWYDNFNIESRCFEILGDLAIKSAWFTIHMIYNKLISVNRKHDVEQLKHRCYFIVLNDSINLFPEHKNCIHYAIFMFSTQPTNIYLNLCLRSLINRSRCRNY